VNFGTIGRAILWTPFYAVGDLAARASGASADGFSRPYVAAIAYGSALYGFAAIVLAVVCAQRLGLPAFGAAAAIWLGTPLLFYMYVAPPFSHACSAFAVAVFVWTWLRVRERWTVRGAVALGAAGALMAMVREQDLFFVAGPALDYLLTLRRGRTAERAPVAIGHAIGIAAAAAMAFAIAFVPQAIAYVRLNGHLGPSRLVTRKMSWHAPHALQVLLSPQHGFLVWTPLALIAIAGLVLFAVNARDVRSDDTERPPGSDVGRDSDVRSAGFAGGRRQVAICMLLMVALQIYVGGSVESWTVAGAFGQRRFVALTVLLVLGLAALLDAASRRGRRALALVIAVAVYWNVALIAEFATGLMDRQRLEPAKNAYDAFVTLPRIAPSLAYRYLFDRASFYQKSRPS
jgi:hypothetical protein